MVRLSTSGAAGKRSAFLLFFISLFYNHTSNSIDVYSANCTLNVRSSRLAQRSISSIWSRAHAARHVRRCGRTSSICPTTRPSSPRRSTRGVSVTSTRSCRLLRSIYSISCLSSIRPSASLPRTRCDLLGSCLFSLISFCHLSEFLLLLYRVYLNFRRNKSYFISNFVFYNYFKSTFFIFFLGFH